MAGLRPEEPGTDGLGTDQRPEFEGDRSEHWADSTLLLLSDGGDRSDMPKEKLSRT